MNSKTSYYLSQFILLVLLLLLGWADGLAQDRRVEQVASWRKLTVETMAVFTRKPIHQWKKGMIFVMSSPENAEPNSPVDGFYFSIDYDQVKGAPRKPRQPLFLKDMVFKKLTLVSIEERPVRRKVFTYLVFQLQGMQQLVEYQIKSTLEELANDVGFYIPNICSYDDIQLFNQLVLERTVFLRNKKQQLSGQQAGKAGIVLYIQNFVSAQVIDIQPYGDGRFEVFFQTAEGDHCAQVVSLGGTNEKPKQDPANFDRFFLFDHPKYHFDGSQKQWDHILHGRLVDGMKAEYVRLAYGDPLRIKTNHSGSVKKWYYDIKILKINNGKLSWYE